MSKKKRRRQTSGRSSPNPRRTQPVGAGAFAFSGPEPAHQRAPVGSAPSNGQDHVAEQGLHTLVGLIVAGRLDEHLGRLQAAIAQRHRDRRRDAARRAAARLQIGDRVKLNSEIRPLYLQGACGTIVGWASQNAVVELDQPVGRYNSGQIRCPPLGLQPLPE